MTSPKPPLPKLRLLDITQVVHKGQQLLMLRDPMGLTDGQLMVPMLLGPLLGLCDGTRDIAELTSALALQTGLKLTVQQVEQVIDTLSQTYLLEDERYTEALTSVKTAYANAPHRQPALAGRVYPDDPGQLRQTISSYCDQEKPIPRSPDHGDQIQGLISPHIDYARGAPIYAQVWRQAASTIKEVDLVIIFGTDHNGGPGKLTLTTQNYATPWGVLPTCQPIVDKLATSVGDIAFDEEIHHRNEHSIELALVWLHYFLGTRVCEIVPVLCGSFHEFIRESLEPGDHPLFQNAIKIMREEAAGRRTLVIAAADLAHVGPVFGDSYTLDTSKK
ncbi:AmmeMemoRadiSam system protein B, partial [Dehalococcoidia bacterium]|nr:AmmeMemoRadiSam system protein B [Dehalococcoidia bacterium]